MLVLIQLLLAVFAILSALTFSEEVRLVIPLFCLIGMFMVSRVDKRKSDSKTARKVFLQSEIDKVLKKDSTLIKEQDFFTIDLLLWPKSELLLIDTVHSIFKDLGFRISAPVSYHSVDRIVRIPETPIAFGLQILMTEGEVEGNHPKIHRALQFEQEKKENEKSLIIGSTHIHLPLSERSKVNHLSREVGGFLMRHHMTFITTHHLYELWQKSKKGEINIFDFFEKIYSHSGVPLPLQGTTNFRPSLFDLPVLKTKT